MRELERSTDPQRQLLVAAAALKAAAAGGSVPTLVAQHSRRVLARVFDALSLPDAALRLFTGRLHRLTDEIRTMSAVSQQRVHPDAAHRETVRVRITAMRDDLTETTAGEGPPHTGRQPTLPAPAAPAARDAATAGQAWWVTLAIAYLIKHPPITAAELHRVLRRAAHEHGAGPVPGLRAVQRIVREFSAGRGLVRRTARERDSIAGAFARQDVPRWLAPALGGHPRPPWHPPAVREWRHAPNEAWIVDAFRLPLWVRDAWPEHHRRDEVTRPFLYVALSARERAPKRALLTTAAPCSQLFEVLLVGGLRPDQEARSRDLPRRIVLEVGAAKHRRDLQGRLAALGVRLSVHIGGAPQRKGVVERWFGDLERQYLTQLPGWDRRGASRPHTRHRDELLTLDELRFRLGHLGRGAW